MSVTMSFVRCLYYVCWRNRLIIPLIITCASFAMLITLFYHRSFIDLMEHNDEYFPHKRTFSNLLGGGKKVLNDQKSSFQWSTGEVLEGHQDVVWPNHNLPGIHDPGGIMAEHAERHKYDAIKAELERQKVERLLQKKWGGVDSTDGDVKEVQRNAGKVEAVYGAKNARKNIGKVDPDGMQDAPRNVGKIDPDGMQDAHKNVGKVDPDGMKDARRNLGKVDPDGMKDAHRNLGKVDPDGMKDARRNIGKVDPDGMKDARRNIGKVDPDGMKDARKNIGKVDPDGMLDARRKIGKVDPDGMKDASRKIGKVEPDDMQDARRNIGKVDPDGMQDARRNANIGERIGAINLRDTDSKAKKPVGKVKANRKRVFDNPKDEGHRRNDATQTSDRKVKVKKAAEYDTPHRYHDNHADAAEVKGKSIKTKVKLKESYLPAQKIKVLKKERSGLALKEVKRHYKNSGKFNIKGEKGKGLEYKNQRTSTEATELQDDGNWKVFFRPKYADSIKVPEEKDIGTKQDDTFRLVQDYLDSKKAYQGKGKQGIHIMEQDKQQTKFKENQPKRRKVAKDDPLQNEVLRPEESTEVKARDARKNIYFGQSYEVNNNNELPRQKDQDSQETGDAKKQYELGQPKLEIHFPSTLPSPLAHSPTTGGPHGHGQNMDILWDKIQHNRTFAYDVRPDHRASKETWKPHHSTKLFRHRLDNPEVFQQWSDDSNTYCIDAFTGFHNEFAILHNAVIDMNFATGRPGGEEINQVINQPEEEEYYQFQYGFIQLSCEVKPDYFFNNNNHNNQWLSSMQTLLAQQEMPVDEVVHRFTIAITRYEYANIYHTMTDFYNAFLLMEYFNKSQAETNILIVDGHPKGALDPVWDVLFNSSMRISKLRKRTRFTTLVWGILGYNSHIMDHFAPNLPLVSEFQNFFLSSYGISNNRTLDCDKISITFVWRRDYLAHPRNPSGSISRKIQNEQELVDTLRNSFPHFNIKGVQIDLFDMHQQLEFITSTDIMIGMHGAGLTHVMFLPSHAGVIELLPVYWAAANEHFEAIARWRDLLYLRWVNSDPGNEAPNYHTIVPPDILNTMVTSTVEHMCQTAHREGKQEETGHHQFGR